MPIKIRDRIEPLSEESFTLGEPSAFADSNAMRQLRVALDSYVRGKISGISYLIAGHRGAGKTTLVHRAIEDVLRSTDPARFGLPPPKQLPKTRIRRPLLVRLNGPNLLPANKEGAEDVLLEIGKTLYGAFVDEITAAFRRAAETDSLHAAELLEISAALKIELHELPSDAWLREVWERAGRFGSGILFSPTQPVPMDQGLRELVALSSALQAYAVISGKVDAAVNRNNANENVNKTAISVLPDAATIKSTVTSLFAGGAAGGAAAVAGGDKAYALLAGALVGLMSLIGFNFSSTLTRTRSISYKMTYLPNKDVNSLARTLPDVVARIFDAGLAPVFVVDELDKVDQLPTRMSSLVRNLKQFVTERAFFCFLVDRVDFERFSGLRRKNHYGLQYTFFSDRLFVSYTPVDLHGYLKNVLEPTWGST